MICTPHIIWVINSRRMRWAGNVARMVRGEPYREFWWGNLSEGGLLGDPGVGGRIILRWIFRKWIGRGHDLAEDRDWWQGLVHLVMNLWVP